MQKLNLPYYNFRFKKENQKTFIFDELRHKYLILTPEEWVRQNLIKFFISEKNVPAALISQEKEIQINELKKRYDAMIFDRNAKPRMLVECKAPNVRINENTFNQIAEYNMAFKVPFLFVSNGIDHYICFVDFKESKFNFLKSMPDYKELLS